MMTFRVWLGFGCQFSYWKRGHPEFLQEPKGYLISFKGVWNVPHHCHLQWWLEHSLDPWEPTFIAFCIAHIQIDVTSSGGCPWDYNRLFFSIHIYWNWAWVLKHSITTSSYPRMAFGVKDTNDCSSSNQIKGTQWEWMLLVSSCLDSWCKTQWSVSERLRDAVLLLAPALQPSFLKERRK